MPAAILAFVAFLLLLSAVETPAEAALPEVLSGRTIVQPSPLEKGPGSLDYSHSGWRVSEGGKGYDAWIALNPQGQARPGAAGDRHPRLRGVQRRRPAL